MDWTLTIVVMGGALWGTMIVAEIAFKIWLAVRSHRAQFNSYWRF